MQTRAGQSMIESCVVVGIICLFLMGLFQLSQLYMAREIMYYAAGRGARAQVVGFNDFMVYKTIRVATIPAAGQMLDRPADVNSPTAQRGIERGRIPLYLEAEHYGLLAPILDYTNWNTINHSMLDFGGGMVECLVRQDHPVRTPVFRAFYSGDSVPISGAVSMDSHYPLYLQNPEAAP